MDPYSIIKRPHLTEKTMNAIEQNNELTFVVKLSAKKSEIKNAFEDLYAVKVEKLNTQVTSKGEKLVYIKLAAGDSAEDIAVRMGVF